MEPFLSVRSMRFECSMIAICISFGMDYLMDMSSILSVAHVEM